MAITVKDYQPKQNFANGKTVASIDLWLLWLCILLHSLFYRVNNYLKAGIAHLLVDPDDNSIYPRRKINRLSPKDQGAESANLNLAPLEKTTVSDNSKNGAFPFNGWGTSLSKSPMFTRAES